MTCRQYTCGNCWNAADGRYLTCAPHLGHEILPAPFPDETAFEPVRLDSTSWAEIDIGRAGLGGEGNGNGNGRPHEVDTPDADPWAAVGATDLGDLPEFDAAARLAFLSGDAPAPSAPVAPVEAAAQRDATAADLVAAAP